MLSAGGRLAGQSNQRKCANITSDTYEQENNTKCLKGEVPTVEGRDCHARGF